MAIVVLLLFIILLFYMMPNPGYSEDSDHEDYRRAHADSLQSVIDSPDTKDGTPGSGEVLGHYRAKLPTYHEERLGNFEDPHPFKPEKSRPGDYGKKYNLEDVADVDQNEVSVKKSEYGMNIVASDHIPMDRIVPDLRHPECKHWDYPDRLPTASVVIVFHNEGFSTLLRTVHSVLIRSPQRFLREVLLVDDFSSKEPLKGKFVCLFVSTSNEYSLSFTIFSTTGRLSNGTLWLLQSEL